MPDTRETESLSTQADHALEEARMVLPGAQALFGFQLVAVFDPRFEILSERQQLLHLAALFAVAVAIALIMTPAMYHRKAEPHSVSRTFIAVATRSLTASAYPLLIGIALEFYLVASVVTTHTAVTYGLTALLVAVFVALWFGLPWWRRPRRKR